MPYFDNAATTRPYPEVLEAMTIVGSQNYANPSSIHSLGNKARQLIDQAREKVARLINADPSEIYFTSGGTEANNWLLRGFPTDNIYTSAIEHHAVLRTMEAILKQDQYMTWHKIPVDTEGFVRLEDVSFVEKGSLVSVMLVNNETGVLQHLEPLVQAVHLMGGYFHTDAVQAAGHIPIDVKSLGVDYLSISAHKFYGPKGVGCLYIKGGAPFPEPLITGGAQENGYRAGTENVPAIVGFGVAAELALNELRQERLRVLGLRHDIIDQLKQIGAVVNGPLGGYYTSGNILNLRFPGIPGDALVNALNEDGFQLSTGSACTSGDLDPSHVLTAMGLTADQADEAIRISMGRYNNPEQVDLLVEAIKKNVEKIRKFLGKV